jgi:hypothetical protein
MAFRGCESLGRQGAVHPGRDRLGIEAVRRIGDGAGAEAARQETVHRSLGYSLILPPGCRLWSFVVHQILII